MEKKEILQTCRQYSSHYNEIEPYIFQMNSDDKIAKKILDEILHREEDAELPNRYPEGWFKSLAGQYAAAHVMTDPQAISRLHHKYRDQLSDSAIKALDFWQKHPFRWEFFEINQEHGNHVYTIRDLLTGEETLLYSTAITDMQGVKETCDCVYCTILFENGACDQTVGIIHSVSLTRDDIEFFCQSLDKVAYNEGNLDEVINANFLDFIFLDDIATIPPVYSNGTRVAFHWKAFEFSNVRDLVFPGEWKSSSKTFLRDEFLRLDYLGANDALMERVEVPSEMLAEKSPTEFWKSGSMDIGSIYLNLDNGSVGVESMTLRSFQMLVCILSSVLPGVDPLTNEPDWILSPQLLTITKKIEDFNPPWFDLKKPFDHEYDNQVKNERIESFNQVLQSYISARNEGKNFNLKQACFENDLEESEIQSVIQTLEKNMANKYKPLELSEEDRALALSYPTPPPSSLKQFGNDLDQSGIFRTNDDNACYELFATLTNNSYVSEVKPGGIGRFVSGLFANEFGRTDGYHLMDAFFFILILQDGERLTVRAYALELLKLFHQAILPSLGLDAEGFINRFSNFVYRKLCRCALVMVDSRPTKENLAKGTYLIHSSEFFDDFLEPNTK